MIRLSLIALLFAGCSASASAPSPQAAKAHTQKASAVAQSSNFGGMIPGPSPGQTPRGWVVVVTNATVGGFDGRYEVPRHPTTTNAEPGGVTQGGHSICGVACLSSGSRVTISQQGGATLVAKGFGGGTSFATTGNIERGGGGVAGTFTATVTAIP